MLQIWGFLVVAAFKPMQLCLQGTALNLQLGYLYRRNFGISVAPELEGQPKYHIFAMERKRAPQFESYRPWKSIKMVPYF